VIALAVAIGPSTLLCTAWSDPHAAAVNGCHEGDASTSPVLSSEDSCDNALVGASALVPEKVRRGVSAEGSDVAVTVARHHLGGSGTDHAIGYNRRLYLSFDARPVTTALRI
jgi:hypothetical protein